MADPVRLWSGPGPDPCLAWLHSDEAVQYQGRWVALDADSGEFLGAVDETRDRLHWHARGALVVFVDPPDADHPVPTLEERVAALEEALAHPPRFVMPSWEPLTSEQEAELRESVAEVMRQPITYHAVQQPPPLTPDEVRHLLRECVTVVKPGETLVIRGQNWTPNQVRELQHAMDFMREDGMIGFKVLIVFGDELGVVQPEARFT